MSEKDIQSNIWHTLGGEWADKYWKIDQKRGRQFVEYFKNKNIESVLEIGCSSGRNLWYINENMSIKKICGIEISPVAAELARKNIPSADIYEMNLHDMNEKDKYDVVFTGGVLMHIPGEDVKDVIKKCIYKANKYVVHMEPTGIGLSKYKVRNNGDRMLRCFHNLKKIYSKLGYKKIDIKYKNDDEPFIAVNVA